MLIHALLVLVGIPLAALVGWGGEIVLRSLIYTYEPELSAQELAEIASCK